MFNCFQFSKKTKKANLTFAFFISVLATASSLAASPSKVTAPTWSEVKRIADEKNLAQSTQWKRLGYSRCSLGSCESEQDGQIFFLSPDGKTDPIGEFAATLAAFEKNEKRDFGKEFPAQTAHCQFPARLTWLARETGGWDANALLKECKEQNEFLSRLNATGASLVFSSFYLNNPSSAFGHTLLKIHKGDNRQGTQADLLNYGVGYAANPTTDNPIFYALFGLFGGFNGTYASLPYYYKVREYNDFENRDLWEYELDLRPEEIDMLVKHLWELGFAGFRYFYLSENCSYQLMNLLDVAAPRLNLAEPLPIYVLPIDTVKAVHETPGLVKKINHRPALASSLERRFSTLNQNERVQFFKSIENYEPEATMTVKVLDTVIDHFDMNKGKLLIAKDAEASQTKHHLLVKRAAMNDSVEPLPPDTSKAPHLAHGSLRLEVGYGQRDTETSFLDDDADPAETAHFGVRLALHDLTDPVTGLPPYARLEMGYWDFFYDFEKDRLRADRFRFVGIEALNSWSILWKRPSWRFDLGYERIQDARCFDCLTGLAGGSIGVSIDSKIGGVNFAPFIYANARTRTGRFANEDISVEAGPSVGLRVISSAGFNLLAEYERRTIWNRFRTHDDVIQVTLQKMFTPKIGAKAQLNNSDHAVQARASLLFF
jgi:hypothetical protein